MPPSLWQLGCGRCVSFGCTLKHTYETCDHCRQIHTFVCIRHQPASYPPAGYCTHIPGTCRSGCSLNIHSLRVMRPLFMVFTSLSMDPVPVSRGLPNQRILLPGGETRSSHCRSLALNSCACINIVSHAQYIKSMKPDKSGSCTLPVWQSVVRNQWS